MRLLTRPQRCISLLLMAAVLWAQMLGMAHRVAHANTTSAGHTHAVHALLLESHAHGEQGHGHGHGHGHDCDQDHADAHAHPFDPVVPWGHAAGSDACAAYDHAALADEAPGVPLALAWAALRHLGPSALGHAQHTPARSAAYQATGPPTLLT